MVRCKVCGNNIHLRGPDFSGCLRSLGWICGIGIVCMVVVCGGLALVGNWLGPAAEVQPIANHPVANPPAAKQVPVKEPKQPNKPPEKVKNHQPEEVTPPVPKVDTRAENAQREWQPLEERLAIEPFTPKLKADLDKFIVNHRGTPQEAKASTEVKAYNKLVLAKKLLERDNKTQGKKWLSEVKEEFPGTNCAREAQSLLDNLQ